MTYRYLLTKPYIDCVETYRTRNQQVLVDLQFAVNELAVQPFENPRLQTHRMHRAEGKTFISYVGNRGHRLIWRLVQQTIVMLLFGEHDPVERRAERLRLQIDLEHDVVRIMDADPSTSESVRYEQRRQAEGHLFMAWSDQELREYGFQEQEVPVLRGLDSDDDLLALEDHMRADAFRVAYNLLAHGHPDGEEAAVAARPPAAAEAAAAFELEDERQAAEDRQLERKLTDPAAREEFAPVSADALATVLEKPIEDWMVFLHPDQVRLTERPFAGPARVRGAAGTGKTVVALHRARHLANTYERRVLFTTYVTNLPPVFEHLYRRLAPNDQSTVEFTNLHKWAWRCCAQQGEQPNTDIGQVNAAYAAAWQSAVTPGSVIAQRRYGRQYYRDEIDWVIKGRGLERLDDYLALARTGRGTPLNDSHRRNVWKLYSAYQDELRRRGVHDFNDVLLKALELVEGGAHQDVYAAVVVDEAQDLTVTGVRLCHALAGGDRRDGLFLVGDGQQAVYPGGYSLAQVGIDVVGRSSVLKVNYRNTRQVLDAAQRVVDGRPFDDLDDEIATGTRHVEVVREGRPPVFNGYPTEADHDTALVAAIDEAVSASGMGPGDLAVLVPTNRQVDHFVKCIADLGYPAMKLERYDGTPNQQVKVGTYQRGKGLEFKWVFMPRLDGRSLGEQRQFNEDESTYAERIDLLRRRLFVSMTRARDQLWGGWVGEAAAILNIDHSIPHTIPRPLAP